MLYVAVVEYQGFLLAPSLEGLNTEFWNTHAVGPASDYIKRKSSPRASTYHVIKQPLVHFPRFEQDHQ